MVRGNSDSNGGGGSIIEEAIKHQEGSVKESNSDTKFSFNDEQRAAFRKINRDQESLDVVRFQKTGDADILEKLYNNRIQTLKIWSN